jgi:spermidine synthase
MSFLCGAVVGLQFPLATKLYLRFSSKEGTLGQTAGLLYGADLFGGFFGGLFGGVLLLPILGLKESCFMMAIIKVSSFTLFLLSTKIRR